MKIKKEEEKWRMENKNCECGEFKEFICRNIKEKENMKNYERERRGDWRRG